MKIIETKLCNFHNITLDSALDSVEKFSQSSGLDIVVTPNVDHMARLATDNESPLHDIYKNSSLCICDSRILQKLLSLKGKTVSEVIPGSTLTQILFDSKLTSEDNIVIIGGSEEVLLKLKAKYKHLSISHHNPPMGFINRENEVQKAIDFCIEMNPDFIFLAVGSPRQEVLAEKIKKTHKCSAVALCIGASILFLVDEEKRAPLWMQKANLEWLFRMLQDPRRLMMRYWGNFLRLHRIFKKI